MSFSIPCQRIIKNQTVTVNGSIFSACEINLAGLTASTQEYTAKESEQLAQNGIQCTIRMKDNTVYTDTVISDEEDAPMLNISCSSEGRLFTCEVSFTQPIDVKQIDQITITPQ